MDVQGRGEQGEKLRNIGKNMIVSALSNVWLQTYLGYKARFYWSSPTAYILNVAMVPVFMMLGFGFLAAFAVDADLTRHIVVGMSVNGSVLYLVNEVTLGFQGEKWTGNLTTIFLPAGNRIVHYFGRGVVHYPHAFFTIAVGLLAGVLILGIDFSNANWGLLLVSAFLTVTSIIMFMLLMGDLVLMLKSFQNLYMASLGVIVGLTGVVVPVSDLPLVFEAIAHMLPISHGLVAFRDSLAGAGFSDVVGNLLLEAAVGAGYALVGYVGFVLVERQLKIRGTMEQQDI